VCEDGEGQTDRHTHARRRDQFRFGYASREMQLGKTETDIALRPYRTEALANPGKNVSHVSRWVEC